MKSSVSATVTYAIVCACGGGVATAQGIRRPGRRGDHRTDRRQPAQPAGDEQPGRRQRPARHRLGRERVIRERKRRQAIREQVDAQHLNDAHRRARAHEDADHEQEHLTEVRGQKERHEGAHVLIDPPPLLDRRDDGRERVVREDDVGRLACRLGSVPAHRDADIGAPERRGVVHPVARDHHHLAVRLEGRDEPELVHGRDPGEDGVRTLAGAQLLVAQGGQLASRS